MSSPSTAADSLLDKPRLSDSKNYLVKHNLHLTLPDNTHLVAKPAGQRDYFGFLLMGQPDSCEGMVEFVRLTETAGTLSAYLREYEKNAKKRSESYSWKTYIDYFNPCRGTPLQYRVLEEYDADGLSHVLIVAASLLPDGSIQKLNDQFDIYVVQLRRLALPAAEFSRFAEYLLAGMHYSETASDVRRLPDGMFFHSIGSKWHWVSDLDGGMYLSYDEDSANRYMGIALCRLADESAAGQVLLPSEARPLTTGTRRVIIGRNTVQVDYTTNSFPAEHALRGRQEHVLAFDGRFRHNGSSYLLYLRNNFNFNPVNIEMDDTSVLSYLFSTRGGIVDALGFMLELDSLQEAEQ